MFKKSSVKILFVGALLTALLFGCGKVQSEEFVETETEVDREETDPAVDQKETSKVWNFETAAAKSDRIQGSENDAKADDEKEIDTAIETDIAELLGSWEVTFDYATVIEEELGSDFYDFHEKFELTIYLDFHDDGTFEMYVDAKEVEPTLQNYFKSLAKYTADYMYEMFEGTGLSQQEVDDLVEEEFGMNIYDYMLGEFMGVIDAEELAEELFTSGVYEVRGNHLHMDEYEIQDDTYDIFRIEGDTLTLTLPEGAENELTGIEGFDYPYVFTRVAE